MVPVKVAYGVSRPDLTGTSDLCVLRRCSEEHPEHCRVDCGFFVAADEHHERLDYTVESGTFHFTGTETTASGQTFTSTPDINV